MSTKEKKIEPELFEIKTKFTTFYVIGYGVKHAIDTVFDKYSETEIHSAKKITDGWDSIMLVSNECLPQGLISKTITTK